MSLSYKRRGWLQLGQLIFFGLLLAGWLPAAPVGAQDPSAESLCVVLVLDASGSVKSNDPDNLRFTAARLFVSLLDVGDRVGLVEFSTGSRLLTEGLLTINGPADKTTLNDLLAPTPANGYTDVKAALENAAAMLYGEVACGQRTIVLLTDGEPEIETYYFGYEDEALAVAQNLNVPVMSIALTPAGQSPFLQRLSAVTDPAGTVIPAADASALLDAYLDVLGRLKDRTVAGGGTAQAPTAVALPLDPALVPYVQQVSFVVSTPPNVAATLLTPDGNALDPADPSIVFSQADPRFVVVTVANPAGGDWAFQLEGAGAVQARAVVRSRLRVAAVQPGPFHPLNQPMSIVANLIEEAEDGIPTTLIGEATFSALIQRPDGSREALDLLYDDGTHGDQLASDGDFTGSYVNTDLPGVYQITLRGRKGVIPVSGRVRVSVAPFPSLMVEAPAAGQYQNRGEALPLSVTLTGAEPAVLDQGEVLAEISTPDGRTEQAALTISQDGNRYTGEYQPTADGPYTVRFVSVEAQYQGVPFQVEAMQEFSVVMVPAVTVVDQSIELGTVEIVESALMPLMAELRLASTSGASEPVTLELADLPGLRLTDVSPEGLAPADATVLHLTLDGSALTPGDYQATLIVSVRDGVDLDQREIPLSLSIHQPILTISPSTLELGEIRADRLGGEQKVSLTVDSSSLREESLPWPATQPQGLNLSLQPTVVSAGQETKVELKITLPIDLPEGEYTSTLQLAARQGVILEPSVLDLHWTVTPVPWTARYGLPLAVAAVLLLASLVAFGVWRSRIQRLWGLLAAKKIPPGALKLDYHLYQSDWRGRVLVGSGKGCQIQLVHPSVQARHALILAELQTVTEPMGRPPRPVTLKKPVCVIRNLGDGIVQVGGARLLTDQTSQPLKRGTRVKFCDCEFEWRET